DADERQGMAVADDGVVLDPVHARRGSISTPGFSSAAGSSALLAALRAPAKRSGRWLSYQRRWSRPTAWWWVIVAPAAMSASLAAALISAHWVSSSPRRPGAMTV